MDVLKVSRIIYFSDCEVSHSLGTLLSTNLFERVFFPFELIRGPVSKVKWLEREKHIVIKITVTTDHHKDLIET